MSRITAVTVEGQLYWLCVQRDISDARRTNEALRESEARLRLAVGAGRMAVWEWDAASDRVRPSPELNRMLGFEEGYAFTREEVAAKSYPGDWERLGAAARGALASGDRHFEVEFRYGFPGPARWLLLRAEFLLDARGRPAGVIGVLLDISEREHARAHVEELEEELRSALSAGSLGTYSVDHVTGEVRTSPGLNAIYGYPEGQPLTLADLRARYHPEDAERVRSSFGAADSPNVSRHEVELRLVLPGGATKWVYGKGEYIRDGAGTLLRSRGVILDITERKRSEEHLQLLVNELNHRVKNTLATVQSIVVQSLRNATRADDARAAIEGRLQALSRAHDVLTRENWERAELSELTAHALAPYCELGRHRVHVSGPSVDLPPRMALALAMAFQELATNAVKYGALSNASGSLLVSWTIIREESRRMLHLRWEESGGPPVAEPKRHGFGTRLIERSLAQDLEGEARITFATTGLVCTVDAPVP